MTTCYLDIANSSSVFSPMVLKRDPAEAWLWLFREHLARARERGVDTVIIREPWRWHTLESNAFAGPPAKGKYRRAGLAYALQVIAEDGIPIPNLWHYGRLPAVTLGPGPGPGYVSTIGDARILDFLTSHFIGESWDESAGANPAQTRFLNARYSFRATYLEPLHDKARTDLWHFPVDVVDEVAMNPSPSQVIPYPSRLRVWQHAAHPETRAGTLELVKFCRAKGWEPCPTLWMFTRQDAEAVTSADLALPPDQR